MTLLVSGNEETVVDGEVGDSPQPAVPACWSPDDMA